MLRPRHALIALLLLAVFGVVWFLVGGQKAEAPAPGEGESSATSAEFVNQSYGLAFTYPTFYFVTEYDREGPSGPFHEVSLIEDTQEHRDLVAGKNPVPREGPPAITVSIFSNDAALSVSDWIKTASSSNFALSPDDLISEMQVAGKPAHFYRFSGLYEGYALAVAGEGRIYMFTVQYLTREDRIIEDYNDLLETVVFTQ